MDVLVVDHPLVGQLLTRLRDERTDRAAFSQTTDDLSHLLVYEATRTLTTEPVAVRTPLVATTGVRISRVPLVVPVLRAGLGMLHPVLRLLPDAATGFVGVARDEDTHQPEPYLTSVPEDLAGRDVLVLDPMLATGGSMALTCGVLAARGAGTITAVCILAAPEGIERLREGGDVHRLVTAAVDDHLDADAFIVPGLGDAGDRLFGGA